MIAAIWKAWANFRGFDLTGSTVPPMDGPLRPNAKLDAMPVLMELDDVDNLTAAHDGIFCSSGNDLLTFSMTSDASQLQLSARCPMDGPVTSIAALGESLAIAVEGRGILLEGAGTASRPLTIEGLNPSCVTAMAFADPTTLFVAVGSDRHAASEWKRDLMTKSASGSVWRIETGSGRAERLVGGLEFAAGLALSGKDIFVAEAWRHRVLALTGGSQPRIALAALPAYPGRMTPSASGGFWLAMFAPRNPLVEFVLKEDEYRRRMVDTIEPAYWIAPALVTGKSFLEPIQGGARKKLNMLKPWSPTWSTGLVVRCDDRMAMLRSYQSRADGGVHGVMSLCETGGRLIAGARGSGKIVAIDDETAA